AMERRTVLRVLSSALLSGALGRAATAAAQSATPRPPATKWVPAEGAPVVAGGPAPTASAPGVTAKEIRIGMSAAFKGTAAGLGTEFYRGAQACYGDINARGGVFGRFVNVVALNDGYEPLPCVQNTIQLVEKEGVFFLSNYAGTPPVTRALPVI